MYYLGCTLNKDGSLTSDVEERVKQENETVTRNRNVSTEVEKTLHDSMLLYAA